MSDPLVDLVLEEPADRLRAFAEALVDGRIDLRSGRPKLNRAMAHGPSSLERMVSVLRHWEAEGGTPRLLASAVLGQLAVREVVEERGPRCELVWTGEGSGGATVRSTAPVVEEMLAWATTSVLVISYSVWLGDQRAGRIIERLAELSSGGVDVTFLLDARYRDGWNLAELRRRWPTRRRSPVVFSWQSDGDDMAKLHAKVMLVDRREILVTSANLTGHGLKGNLEFGLRVRGAPAEQAATHFDSLLSAGAFDRVAW